MLKKILAPVVAVVVVAGGVAAMSAFEAHIINVTAHVENALSVHPTEIAFGTVFPQEFLLRQFTVDLSRSFQAAPRVDAVSYVIKNKPKCKAIEAGTQPQFVPVDYATHECPAGYAPMLDLCQYLSKNDTDPGDNNDSGVPSYFIPASPNSNPPAPASCQIVTDTIADGILSKSANDLLDAWTVDFKVPPVRGTVGQEWPAGCPLLAENDKDYGCDFWIEVTGIRETPAPTGGV